MPLNINQNILKMFPYIAILYLLLFCNAPCVHAQGNNRCEEMPDTSRTYFISYKLEGGQGHRLFLQNDTLGIEVNGMELFPSYTVLYAIAQDSCLIFQDRQVAQKGIKLDLPAFALLEGQRLQRISDKEIRISGQERPYFREQTVKDTLNGMDMLWVYNDTLITNTAELEKLRNRIDNNPDIQIQVMAGKEAFCMYGITGINGVIVINNRTENKRVKH